MMKTTFRSFRFVLCAACSLLLMAGTGNAHDFGGNPVPGSAPADGGGRGGGGEACQQGSANPLDNKCDKIAVDGKQIYFYDGSEFTREIDLRLDGIMPIVVERSYNNQSTLDTPLGYGWDYTYNEHLYTYADGSVIIRRDTGFKERFVLTGNAFVSENGRTGTLAQGSDGTFTYTPLRGNIRLFDRDGRLVRLTDPHGNSLRMQWSDNKMPLSGQSPYSVNPTATMMVANSYQLLRVEEWTSTGSSTGRYVQYNYNATTGRLTSISDSTGRTVSYQQDAIGNLTRVDFPLSLYRTYSYTDSSDDHNLTAIARGYGQNTAVTQVQRTYDSSDRVTRENYAQGHINVTYSIPLQKTAITQYITTSTGSTTQTTQKVYEFNPAGYLLKISDEEKILEYKRDARNNIIEETLSQNKGSYSSPNPVPYRTIIREYDGSNNLTRQQTYLLQSGEVITDAFTYDQGWLTSQQRQSSAAPGTLHRTVFELEYRDGRPLQVAAVKTLVSGDANGNYLTTRFQYDANGQRTGVEFANGDTMTSEYSNGMLTKADGFSFNHDGRGNLTSITDRNNHTTLFEYDLANRPAKVTNALGESTLYTYTGWDLTAIEYGKTASNSGRRATFTRDSLGRMLTSALDLSGMAVEQQTYSYDSEGNILSLTDQLNRTVQFGYDAWNRLIKVTDPLGKITTFTYNIMGKRTKVTDPLAQVTTASYDELGRMNSTTDALGGVTTMAYNALGQVTGVTDAAGRPFSFGYDAAGRMIWQELPPTGRESYTLDARGRVVETLSADNKKNLYEYDSDNRLRQLTLAAGLSESSKLVYGYDVMGNLTWYADTAIGLDPVVRYTYDALNRPLSKTLVPINKTVQYAYTPWGELASMALNSGASELFRQVYSRNTAGWLVSLTEQPLNRTTTFARDLSGALAGITYANNATATLEYNGNGLLGDLHYKNSSSQTLARFQYGYDDLGRITTITDTVGTTNYGYDAISRLTSATYPAGSGLQGEAYTYDATGNRLSSADAAAWQYDQAGRLLGYGATTLQYDQRGNQTSETAAGQTTTYSYDSLNRMTGASRASMLATYRYGLANQRLKKTVDGVTTWYLYEGANLLAEFDGQGNLKRSYAYQPDSFALLAVNEGGQSYPVLNNHLQTPVAALNSSGVPVWQGKYQAFGQAILATDPDGNGTAFTLNQRFPGQMEDGETGLSYNWNRYFNTTIGRYGTVDPLTFSDGTDHYQYVTNNPVNLQDGYGLFSTWFDRANYYFESQVRSHKIKQAILNNDYNNSNNYVYKALIGINYLSDNLDMGAEIIGSFILSIPIGSGECDDSYHDVQELLNSNTGRKIGDFYLNIFTPIKDLSKIFTKSWMNIFKNRNNVEKVIYELYKGTTKFSLKTIEISTKNKDEHKSMHNSTKAIGRVLK